MLSDGGVGAVDADVFGPSSASLNWPKPAVLTLSVGGERGDAIARVVLDDRDRAFRYFHRVVVVGFAFIRRDHKPAIRRKSQHVGQRADSSPGREERALRVENQHLGPGRSLQRRVRPRQRCPENTATLVAASPYCRHVDLADQGRVGRGVADIQDVDCLVAAVDDVGALRRRVIGNDLRGGAVEDPGSMGAERT